MLRSLYSAASGMMAQQINIDTISNNLANVNTAGFKKGRAEFQDLLYAHIRPPISGDEGIMVGQGTRLSSITRIFSGGSTQATGNPFDLMIQGEGFFRVRRQDGSEAYTRDGTFHLDGERRLVTAAGDLVIGEKGPIVIPMKAANPEVTPDGVIRYADTESGQTVVVDRLQIALFANPTGMFLLGNNLWAGSEASGKPTLDSKQAGKIIQGYLETSNVQAVEEMVNLIVAQRAYEINSKAIHSADDMLAMANNLRRG